MDNLPATIPDPATAQLPAAYETARKAIAECYRLDEVKDWADKAAAIATYARMANDDTLRVTAVRIQERAYRRGGELLKQIAPANGANQNIREGDHPKVTRESAARDAGLSEHQRKVALRLASIPEDKFERALESGSPPTLEALAKWGTLPRPQQPPVQPTPTDLRNAAQAVAVLREFATFCQVTDPMAVASASSSAVRDYVGTIDAWLDQVVANLQE